MDHLLKLLIGNGIYAGLRGQKEHWDLKVSQISTGRYPIDHEFSGLEWAGIDHRNRKTNKLGPNNVYFDQDAGVNRQPVWDHDLSSDCWAGSLLRYKAKIGPNQDKFYCYPASKVAMAMYSAQGFPNAVYNPNKVIGENSIAKLYKLAAKRLGFDNPLEITGQMLRRNVVTELVNDPNVNLKESMSVAGHRSVSAHLAYIEKDKKSEVERVKALLPAHAVEKIDDRLGAVAVKPSPDQSKPSSGCFGVSQPPPSIITSNFSDRVPTDVPKVTPMASNMGPAGITTSSSSWSTDSSSVRHPAPITPSSVNKPTMTVEGQLRTLRNKCTAFERRRAIEFKDYKLSKLKLQQEVFRLESEVIELEGKVDRLEEEKRKIKDDLAFFTQRFYGPDA